MSFIEKAFERLQRHPKRVAFADGTNPRVVRAAGEYVKRKLGPAILLGRRRDIAEVADRVGVGLVRVLTIDPANAEDLPAFCQMASRLPKYKEVDERDIKRLLINPNYFGAMMLQHGQCDGLVSGPDTSPDGVLRPLFSLIKPLPHISVVSGCIIMHTDDPSIPGGLLFLADCGVIPKPSIEQLAQIAVNTAQLARQMTGQRPRAALLSYRSRFPGAPPSAHTAPVAAATALAQKIGRDQGLDYEVDGELSIEDALPRPDTIDPVTDAPQPPACNVLIFPDLNAGNIAAAFVNRMAKVNSYGQVLLGLSKPAAVVSSTARESDLVGVAALVALQAIEYRMLYPEQGVPRDTSAVPTSPA